MSAMIILKNQIKLKGGILFEKGEAVEISHVTVNPMICEIKARGISHRVHYSRLFTGPGRNLICAWIARNACKSVLGEDCQPGGMDRAGFPCWSLVYGMQTVRV